MKWFRIGQGLPLLWLAACSTPPAPPAAPAALSADTLWEGEVRIVDNDTVFSPCGSLRRYALTGPALDTIAGRYRHFRRSEGQWMRTWTNGHRTLRGQDTVLLATTFLHLDPAVFCDPVADSAHGGSFVARYADPMGERTMRLELFPNGDALMLTTLQNGATANEVDGRWGLDKDGLIATNWPQRNIYRRYRLKGNVLLPQPSTGNGNEMTRDGVADRQRGAYGRTARWLAKAASKAQGRPVLPTDLAPSTALDELFPTPQQRADLRAAARDTLGFNEERMAREWDAVATVRDVVPLVRLVHLRDNR